MKTLSIAEFEALVARTDWVSVTSYEHMGSVEHSPKEEEWGLTQKSSKLDGIEIVYNGFYEYELAKPETLTLHDCNSNPIWDINGAAVIDESGNKVDLHDLCENLLKGTMFDSVDSSIIPIKDKPEILTANSLTKEFHKIELDAKPDIHFTGKRWILVSSSNQEPWTELSLYLTKDGGFVCHQVGYTSDSSSAYSKGKLCTDEAEIIQFFGENSLAEEVYKRIRIHKNSKLH